MIEYDKFISEDNTFIQPVCNGCKFHFGGAECAAFARIPDAILEGRNHHTKPTLHQNNSIVFAKKKEEVVDGWEEVKRAPAGSPAGGQWIGDGSWVRPSRESLHIEYEVEYKLHFMHGDNEDAFPTEADFIKAVDEAKVVTVTPAMDRDIWKRSHTDTMGELLELIKGYRSYPEYRNEKTLKALEKRIKNREPVDMPIVIKSYNGYEVFSGNTRMDIAFMHKINPKVILLDLSKIKNDWEEVPRAPAGTHEGGQWTSGDYKPTEAEAEAVKDYTGNGLGVINYDKINNYLRTGDRMYQFYHERPGEERTQLPEKHWEEAETPEDELKKRIELIDNFLAKSKPWKGRNQLVERGMNLWDQKAFDFYKNLKPGQELLQKQYLSTAAKGQEADIEGDEDGYWIAGHFLGHSRQTIIFDPKSHTYKNKVGNILLTINTKRGVAISQHSYNPHEREILLPRNSRFKVVSVEYKKPGSLVDLLINMDEL